MMARLEPRLGSTACPELPCAPLPLPKRTSAAAAVVWRRNRRDGILLVTGKGTVTSGLSWGRPSRGESGRWSASLGRVTTVGGGYAYVAAVAAANVPPSKQSKKVTEKHEFDNIQDLIVSPPSLSSSNYVGRQPPTLLEREAKGAWRGGSTVFSRKERIEALNGLLDLLEQKGVSSGYAFEFVRHAGDLIDDLIVEAKQDCAYEFVRRPGNPVDDDASLAEARQEFIENLAHLSTQVESGLGNEKKKTPEDFAFPLREDEGLAVSHADHKREKRICKMLDSSPREEEPGMNEKEEEESASCEDVSKLAFRVSVCAENRGLARLVHYFQLLGMKAQNIPIVLPYVEREIDKVMAKVEFLRSLGVKYLHLPVILVSWPQLLSYPCDSLASKVDYLVSLGLTHKDIGKMVAKFPQILGRDVETELCKSLEVLENLGVQVRDVRKLLVRYPVLLTEEAPNKLDPLVNYLSELGVRKEHIGTMLIRRPLLLDSHVEKDLLPVGDYLKSLNASPDDIDKILMSFPQLFCYDVDQDFRPTVRYLESLGVEPALMGKLFRRHPQLLKNRHNLEPKLDFLRSLGLEEKDLGKVMYNAPQLLCLSIGENMLPTVKFLRSINVEGPLLLKVLRLKPMILAYNVETKLKPNLKFLRSLQIKQGEIGQLVSRHPQLLTLNIEKNLKPTVNYFLKLGFTRAEVADMVRSMPSVLGFSVLTVLAPKYGYLVEVMKRSKKEIVQFPQYFSYSLKNRIIPRHQHLGKLFDSRSLSSVYSCSDDAFDAKATKWLKRRI